jgi:endoglucanase
LRSEHYNKKPLCSVLILSVVLNCLFSSCTRVENSQIQPPPINHDKNYIWLEAEEGAKYRPMIVKSDQSASGQIYIASYKTEPSIKNPPQDGHISFPFTINKGGTYRCWARVIAPHSDSNSYWIKMDDDPWQVWDDIGFFSSAWDWDFCPAGFLLKTGAHTLLVAYREAGTKLDKLLLTDDFLYKPAGCGESSPHPRGKNNFRSPVVDRYGNLQVKGTQLCDEKGNPIQLKGISTHGIQWFPIFKGLTIPNIAEAWGIDVIRPAFYIEDYIKGDFWNGYIAHPEEMEKWEKDYIEDAIKAGIYVIIDWHIHSDPSLFTPQAIKFFGEMSALYGAYPNVIFEVCNEPDGSVAWFTIKRYAEQVIDVIRKNDPDRFENIIIVGTPNWCQYVDLAADDPVTGYNNILYSLHFYAASHGEGFRMRARDALFGTNTMRGNINLNKIPLIVTEWGTCDYSATYNDFAEAQIWLDFLNINKISWINWSLSNKDEASSIFYPHVSLAGPWKKDDYTPSGNWIMKQIARKQGSE